MTKRRSSQYERREKNSLEAVHTGSIVQEEDAQVRGDVSNK